ncbi:MAG: type II secretion system GspH family protein [Lachnospiraceae bacterium]|nr:type II secretion system GspH family protein [Lachnospiraceae bacterium]
MKFFEKLRKKNIGNKGVTLVEVICAVAILSLVGTAVVGLVMVATDSYQRSVQEIEVQQEAQFAANLIGDLVKDASSVNDDGTLIEIEKGGVFYVISYEAASKRVYINDGSGQQLLAEHMDRLPDVNPTPANATHTVTMQVSRDDSINTMKVANTNNSRNEDAGAGFTEGEVFATILCPSEMVVEPNMTKEIEFTVTGTNNRGVTWTVVGANSSYTKMMGNQLLVGENETASVFYINGVTDAKKRDGSTPAGNTTITVLLRRVTGINLTSVLVQGSEVTAGALYRIYADVSGVNLERKPTMETDYISPYRIKWDRAAEVSGHGTEPDSFFYIESTHEGDGPGENYCDIRLRTDLDAGQKIFVIGTSLHTKGSVGGIKYNKSGNPYSPTVFGTFSLEGEAHLYEWHGGNFYRQSTANQGTLEELAVKQIICNQYGFDLNTTILTVFREMRYRERGAASWTSWIPLEEYGNVIRIHEDRKVFACDKDYDIEVRFGARTQDGRKFLPTVLNESAYTIRTGLEHAKIRFDVKSDKFNQNGIYGVGPLSNPISVTAGKELYFNVNQDEQNKQAETGIRWERFKDSLIVKVQKFDGSGWVDVSLKYRNGPAEVLCSTDSGANMAEMARTGKFLKFSQKGTYRILVGLGSETGGKQLELEIYNESSHGYDKRYNQNFYLWNEATGEGIFYVSVE